MLVELNSSEATVHVVGIHLNEISQLILLVGVLIIFVSLARLAWEKFPYKFGPESAYIIVVGCALGGFLLLIGFTEHEVLTFNAEIFFVRPLRSSTSMPTLVTSITSCPCCLLPHWLF